MVIMQSEKHGEVEVQLGNISCMYNSREFCEQLISTVNIVTTYQDDIDQQDFMKRISSMISNE
jgi:hypothetical protein